MPDAPKYGWHEISRVACCQFNVKGDQGQRVLTGKYKPEITLSVTSSIYYNKEQLIQGKPPIHMMQETGRKNDVKS